MKILSASLPAAVTLFRCAVLSDEPLIFPTDTIYGIGAPLASRKANEKIFNIKKRPQGQAMPVLVGSYAQLRQLVKPVANTELYKWLESVWPGGYTVILPARSDIDRFFTVDGTIAVRLVEGWLGTALEATGPVTATSINRSGEAPLLDADSIYERFSAECQYMLWGVSGNHHSKIVDLTGDAVKIIRE